MGNQRIISSLSSLLLFSLLLTTACAQLSRDFYKNTCPNVESLVTSAVTKKFRQTFVTAPATLRLFFHDCFVRVCSALYLFHVLSVKNAVVKLRKYMLNAFILCFHNTHYQFILIRFKRCCQNKCCTQCTHAHWWMGDLIFLLLYY